MSEPFPAPRPITAEERQFIADVENSLRPAFLHAVAEEFGPADRPAAEIAEQMSAAAPGNRLQTVVEARMNSGTHFDALPAEERSAACGRLTGTRSAQSRVVVASRWMPLTAARD